MRTLFWVLIAAAVTFVVLGSLAVVRVVRTKAARVRNRAAATAACRSSPDMRVPIFVCLVAVGPEQATGALRTLLSLFTAATCPLRVTVGVAEYTDGPGPNIAERFVAAAKRAPVPFQLGDNVRILRAPTHEFLGFNVAREQVQRFLYHAETYMGVLAAGALLVPGWDAALVKALTHATATAASAGPTVLTTRLAPATVPGTLGTFVGVGSGRPSLVTYAMKAPASGEAAPSVPALAWSAALSFSQGPLPLAGGRGTLCADDDDVFMTARLVSLGWTLAHPTARIATLAAALPPAAPATTVADSEHGDTLTLGTVALDALGVRLDRTVTHRGRLGLVQPPAGGSNSKDELAVKVGSTADVLSVLSRIDLQQRDQAQQQAQEAAQQAQQREQREQQAQQARPAHQLRPFRPYHI
jgi:hypothetical protein